MNSEVKKILKNWHKQHEENLSFGQKVADFVAENLGSWKFIILQTIIVATWLTCNIVGFIYRWDPFPFILLNLLFSTQAAYSAPIIMMSQNRQAQRDRLQAEADFETNLAAKEEIEQLQRSLSRIENEKLDKILALLEKKR